MIEREQVHLFTCEGAPHLGIAHIPLEPENLGVVIVAGAPQYRVGAHRLFVTIARHLAHHGWPVFRFDRRGFGDSPSKNTDFEHTRPDIHAAIDTLMKAQPHLDGVVLLGLCDGASAALLYGLDDPRIKGHILLNPWARRSDSHARVLLKSHYGRQLGAPTRWWSLLRAPEQLVSALTGFVRVIGKALAPPDRSKPDFVDKMTAALKSPGPPRLVVLSSEDFTADEFDNAMRQTTTWRALAHNQVSMKRVKGADHTFTKKAHLVELMTKIEQWLEKTA